MPWQSTNTVNAQFVIVSGNNGGVFIYQSGTTPGLGNPPISWESSGLIDPFGNILPSVAGVQGSGSFSVGSFIGVTTPGSLPPAPATGFRLYANGNGTLSEVVSSGLAGNVPLVQVDISAHNVGNTTTAGNLTKTWVINANDGVAGTVYKIETYAQMVMGQTAAETITLGINLNGTNTPLATLGASFNGSALSTDYDLPIELTVEINSNGSNAPRVTLDSGISDTSANRLSTNTAYLAGHSDILSWMVGQNNSMAVYAQWGGTGGSVQNISTVSSRLYREGN
jgi:hypothetical protein